MIIKPSKWENQHPPHCEDSDVEESFIFYFKHLYSCPSYTELWAASSQEFKQYQL